jgi:starvation-inducible DNA-binding protein
MEQYTEMWTASDELAERIRALGYYAPGSYSQMAKLTQMSEEDDTPPDWKHMVRTLAKGHEHVARTAREVLRTAEAAGDDATSDVLLRRV